MRTTSSAQMDAGRHRMIHTGNCGCSQNPHRPSCAAMHSSSTRNWINFVPVCTCRHCLLVKPAMPHGASWERTGVGPEGAYLAADQVSQLGPPCTPPLRILLIQYCFVCSSVRSEFLVFARHKSMLIQNKCLPFTIVCFSIQCCRSSRLRYPLQKWINTKQVIWSLAVSAARTNC